MTLVVGALDENTGAVHIAGDSKISWKCDEAKSRRIYVDPVLKVILLSDEVAVGYAGSGPAPIAAEVTKLRGLRGEHLLDGLSQVEGASFVVGTLRPGRLWKVEDGEWGEVTNRGLVIVGDDERLGDDVSVFSLVESRYNDFAGDPAGFRLQSTMQHIVHLVRPESIGGFTVLASGSGKAGFRYQTMPSALFDAIHPTGPVEQPLVLHVLPGAGDTPGAVAYWVPGAGLCHLFCHGQPADPRVIRGSDAAEVVAVAKERFEQTVLAPVGP
ncbi:hypothetical protein ACFXP7_05445 [Microbacterium sp. P06]|uniref:hypothetical protein n=1 Tax=Microbacterium sp. P06 TaxID=3366949 RepID=UPI003747335A